MIILAGMTTGLNRRGDSNEISLLSLLVSKFQGGDIEAFSKLVKIFNPRLMRFLNSVVRDQLLAEEICQQTWLIAFQKINQISEPKQFISWMFTVSRNEFYSNLRSQKETLFSEGQGDTNVDALMFESQRDGAHSDATDDKILLKEIMGKLAEEDRVLLTLLFLEGLSYEETAKILNCNPSSARVRVHRLREQIEIMTKASE